jgi:hypothetical protein
VSYHRFGPPGAAMNSQLDGLPPPTGLSRGLDMALTLW